MELNEAYKNRNLRPQSFLKDGLISVVIHSIIFVVLFLWVGKIPDAVFIAAGEGENGEGLKAGAMQIGVVNTSPVFDVSHNNRKPVSSVDPNKKDKLNNERVEQKVAQPEKADLVLTKKNKPDPETKKIDAPVKEQQSRIYTAKTQKAASTETAATVGTTAGSAKPMIQGGIGIGSPNETGLGTGLPGGSEYGRRIQNILSRNFTPPQLSITGTSVVIIYVKIARDGHITSVVGGRVPRNFFKQNSDNDQLNRAAERAVIATADQGLPPFPGNFMPGLQEAVAEVWFQYP